MFSGVPLPSMFVPPPLLLNPLLSLTALGCDARFLVCLPNLNGRDLFGLVSMPQHPAELPLTVPWGLGEGGCVV